METLPGGCELLLCTFNARYAHASLGLRRLRAQLGPLRERCGLLEFDLETRAIDAAARIIEAQPRLLGLGVYIWNVEQSRDLLRLLYALELPLLICLGGPELGHETDDGEWLALSDFIIRGEGELVFAELARACLALPRSVPNEIVREYVVGRLSKSEHVRKVHDFRAGDAKLIDAELVPVEQLSPVDGEYSEEDLA
ncbi:MAG: hypothetical protein RBU37_16165, partial [Myxococcota bacterium]|nr:hypothetical protein [Myxococcota bacterium]